MALGCSAGLGDSIHGNFCLDQAIAGVPEDLIALGDVVRGQGLVGACHQGNHRLALAVDEDVGFARVRAGDSAHTGGIHMGLPHGFVDVVCGWITADIADQGDLMLQPGHAYSLVGGLAARCGGKVSGRGGHARLGQVGGGQVGVHVDAADYHDLLALLVRGPADSLLAVQGEGVLESLAWMGFMFNGVNDPSAQVGAEVGIAHDVGRYLRAARVAQMHVGIVHQGDQGEILGQAVMHGFGELKEFQGMVIVGCHDSGDLPVLQDLGQVLADGFQDHVSVVLDVVVEQAATITVQEALGPSAR